MMYVDTLSLDESQSMTVFVKALFFVVVESQAWNIQSSFIVPLSSFSGCLSVQQCKWQRWACLGAHRQWRASGKIYIQHSH